MYMELKDLEVYKLSKEISREVWKIYNRLDWRDKKIMGDQWISSTDSISANIAEGFGRFHYLDKNKFNYNARGSLLESSYWTETLKERNKITEIEYKSLNLKLQILHQKLNGYIKTTRNQAFSK